jgi:hypothetical protein
MPSLMGDSVISEVVNSMDRPIQYVWGVLRNMNRHGEGNGELHVRIGITGRGRAPKYRIERWRGGLYPLRREGEILGVFDGRSHRSIEETNNAANQRNWSTSSATKSEVEVLLKRLQSPKRIGTS